MMAARGAAVHNPILGKLLVKILVMDDDPLWTKTMRLVLPAFGVTVETSGELSAAIDLAKAEQCDAILLDLSLAQAGDAEALTSLVHSQVPNIPIVILTGRTDPGDEAVARVIESGAQDWLSKNATAATIVRALRLAVARNKISQLRTMTP